VRLYLEAGATTANRLALNAVHLGHVMKECPRNRTVVCAFARRRELGVDPATLDLGIHVHVVPRRPRVLRRTAVSRCHDCDRAGVECPPGLPGPCRCRMTGDFADSGRVLPIGASSRNCWPLHRAGLSTVFIPLARTRLEKSDVPRRGAPSVGLQPIRLAEIVAQALSRRRKRWKPLRRDCRICLRA